MKPAKPITIMDYYNEEMIRWVQPLDVQSYYWMLLNPNDNVVQRVVEAKYLVNDEIDSTRLANGKDNLPFMLQSIFFRLKKERVENQINSLKKQWKKDQERFIYNTQMTYNYFSDQNYCNYGCIYQTTQKYSYSGLLGLWKEPSIYANDDRKKYIEQIHCAKCLQVKLSDQMSGKVRSKKCISCDRHLWIDCYNACFFCNYEVKQGTRKKPKKVIIIKPLVKGLVAVKRKRKNGIGLLDSLLK